jgi:hypothetical protein
MTRLPFAMENIEPYTHNNAARVMILQSLLGCQRRKRKRKKLLIPKVVVVARPSARQ